MGEENTRMKRLLLAIIYAFIALACTISTVPARMATATPQATVTGTSTPRAAATMQPSATVKPSATVTKYTCTVISDALTVRACGGVDCPAIAWLRAGDTITTSQAITGWIYTGDGWINSIYCEVNK